MLHRLWYCDHYAIALPEGHKFPMAKYRMVRDKLAATSRFHFQCADVAAAETLALAHDPAYVDRVINGALDPAEIRRIGFPWSPALVKRSLASVGGRLGACRDALQYGWGGNLAGGTHHAFRAEGSGFCVFNDIAVAIRWLQHHEEIGRAAVIDLDVHQGDGTAQIFEHDPTVFTLSLHGEKNFPFRKQRSSLDVPLPDGIGDRGYQEALAQALPAVLAFDPDFVFYQSGVDALEADTLGRLKLTPAGLKARDRLVIETLLARDIPFVITLGGGYSHPIEHTAAAHAQTFLTATELLQARAADERGAASSSASPAIAG